MNESHELPGDPRETPISVNTRVRVHSGTDADSCGTVVDDFGDSTGIAVVIGDVHIADAARRWAVLLDSGALVFLDTEALRLE